MPPVRTLGNRSLAGASTGSERPTSAIDRSTAFGCFLAASHLEIFTGVAIEVILDLSFWGARLRWAARADNEPTATEGGDPSGTYKRWFGRVPGRAGWWRGSSLIGNSYW